jgi:hypothetical protein
MWAKWGSPSIPLDRGDLHITHPEPREFSKKYHEKNVKISRKNNFPPLFPLSITPPPIRQDFFFLEIKKNKETTVEENSIQSSLRRRSTGSVSTGL